MLVKNWVSILYCRYYADFVSTSLFNQIIMFTVTPEHTTGYIYGVVHSLLVRFKGKLTCPTSVYCFRSLYDVPRFAVSCR